MNPKGLLFRSLVTSLAGLSLVVYADGATAVLPDCNCYFAFDCPAEEPVCEYTVTGGGPQGPDSPNRSCDWMTPKPLGSPGTGCDTPYTGGGGPCDGVCVEAPLAPVEQEWEHWNGSTGVHYEGTGCLPGGPYSYLVKFVVENEACNLPSHCSLCETEVLIPSDTLASGTASLVGSALSTECSAAGFTISMTDTLIHADSIDQVFDVCVNGVKVASAVSPPGQALVCQDGVFPNTFQVAGSPHPLPSVPGLSSEGLAILASVILAVSFVVLGHRGGVKRS